MFYIRVYDLGSSSTGAGVFSKELRLLKYVALLFFEAYNHMYVCTYSMGHKKYITVSCL